MEQNREDPYVWYMVIYVNDCLIFSREKHMTDELIKQFEANFTLRDEGDVST